MPESQQPCQEASASDRWELVGFLPSEWEPSGSSAGLTFSCPRQWFAGDSGPRWLPAFLHLLPHFPYCALWGPLPAIESLSLGGLLGTPEPRHTHACTRVHVCSTRVHTRAYTAPQPQAGSPACTHRYSPWAHTHGTPTLTDAPTHAAHTRVRAEGAPVAEARPLALPAVRSRPMGSLAGPQNGQRAAHTAVQALLRRQATSLARMIPASFPALQNAASRPRDRGEEAR